MSITDDWTIVESTKRRFADQFFSYDNVNAVGVGRKQREKRRLRGPAVSVEVTRKLPHSLVRSDQLIPPTLPGFGRDGLPIPNLEVQTDVDEGGPYFAGGLCVAAEASPAQMGKKRPIVPGFDTISKIKSGNAGTIGLALIALDKLKRGVGPGNPGLEELQYVTERTLEQARTMFFLTAAHVLVPFRQPLGAEPIFQPAAGDGEEVGSLYCYTPYPQVDYPGLTFATFEDAAVVQLTPAFPITTAIAGIGSPTGQRDITFLDLASGPGPTVKKSGVTTGVTTAQVVKTSFDVDLDVSRLLGAIPLPGAKPDPVRYRDQIKAEGTGVVSCGGDSGSAVLSAGNEVAGLLVGERDDGSSMVFTPIKRVMYAINHPRLSTGRPPLRFVIPKA